MNIHWHAAQIPEPDDLGRCGQILTVIHQHLQKVSTKFSFFMFTLRFCWYRGLAKGFRQHLTQWLPQKQLKLIYRATRDGFSAQSFHQKCDNRGPTLTVIRSTGGYLFGGYTSASWETRVFSAVKTDKNAFLFTLSNPHGIIPTRYTIGPNSIHHAICFNNDNFCAIFGAAYDICVSSNSNENYQSYTNFPCTYMDSSGKGNNTFTGAKNFRTNEIEIYSVIWSWCVFWQAPRCFRGWNKSVRIKYFFDGQQFPSQNCMPVGPLKVRKCTTCRLPPGVFLPLTCEYFANTWVLPCMFDNFHNFFGQVFCRSLIFVEFDKTRAQEKRDLS